MGAISLRATANNIIYNNLARGVIAKIVTKNTARLCGVFKSYPFTYPKVTCVSGFSVLLGLYSNSLIALLSTFVLLISFVLITVI